jgi:DNA modification methylase
MISKLPQEIQILEEAAGMLATCQDLDEIKKIRDKAEALRAYTKQRADSELAHIAAAAIKIRAETRIGELIREMPRQQGKRTDLVSSWNQVESTPRANLGINKSLAHRCQIMAAVPAKEREAIIERGIRTRREPTSHEVYKRGQSIIRAERKRTEMESRARDNGEPRDGSWEIRQGDCEQILASLEAGSVRLIIMDSPYNEDVDYGDHYNDSRPDDEFRQWCADRIRASHRPLSDDGSLWIVISRKWDWVLCCEAVAVGFHLRQSITWFESFGVNMTNKFNACSRTLLWLTKDPKRFVFNEYAPQIRRVSDRQDLYNDPRANPDGKLWDDVWGIKPPIPRLTGTCKERLPEFPTQLPLALLRPIVACASNPGDLVIDPFSGSATTGVACVELGRRFMGIELGEKFVELSRQRLAAVTPSSPPRS